MHDLKLSRDDADEKPRMNTDEHGFKGQSLAGLASEKVHYLVNGAKQREVRMFPASYPCLSVFIRGFQLNCYGYGATRCPDSDGFLERVEKILILGMVRYGSA